MRILKLDRETIHRILTDLLKRGPNQYTQYENSVNEIIADVREHGDRAVFACTEKFDGVRLTAETVEVTEEEIAEAYRQVQPELLHVIRKSKEKIGRAHV